MTSTRHLTDEELYEALALDEANGPAGARVAAGHLAECARCQTELLAVRQSLAGFREATTSLAASAASAGAGSRRMPAPAARLRWLPYARHGLAASLAAVLVVAGAGLAGLHPGRTPAVHGTPVAGVATKAPATAATLSDDELLDGITSDLSASVPTSLEPLSTPAETQAASTHN